MQAHQVQVGVSQGLLDGFARRSGLDRETELRVELTGGDVIVGVGLYAGGDAQHDGRPGASRYDAVEQTELVKAVDDDRRAGAIGGVDVLPAFVVAEEMNPVGRKP